MPKSVAANYKKLLFLQTNKKQCELEIESRVQRNIDSSRCCKIRYKYGVSIEPGC